MEGIINRKSVTLPRMGWVLLVLSICDAVLTDVALRIGIGVEANPVARYLYENMYLGFYIIKVVVPLFILAMCYRITKLKLGYISMSIVLAIYGIIMWFHLLWIAAYLSL